MAAKIVAGVLVILALASAGTVGVAYYNDPTLFDCQSQTPCMIQCPSSLSVPSCSDSDSCCDLEKPACDKPAQESSASDK